jgi:L-asparaginase II
MSDPVTVEVTRGTMVESVHRGAAIVVDADGAVALSIGDVLRPIYPRSAIKALQALPLVESGAADRYGLTPAELALACSSHSGEPGHVATAASMLAKAGRDLATLECGSHWPNLTTGVAQALARTGAEPTALHNNCSGKHSGFVCLACATGNDPKGYVGRGHAVQRYVAEAVGEVTGAPIGETTDCGTDGCSIPTYGFSLTAMATAFARFGTGIGLEPVRAAAAKRLRAACAAEPFMVAGTGRFCTDVMALFGERVFVKTGAEGVFCATFPDQGFGIALKCLDGASRASEVMMAALIARFVPMTEAQAAAFARYRSPIMKNWNGIETGTVRPAGALA